MSFLRWQRLIPSQRCRTPRAATPLRTSSSNSSLTGLLSPELYHFRCCRLSPPSCTSSCLLLALAAQALLVLALLSPSSRSFVPSALLRRGWNSPAAGEMPVLDRGDFSDSSDTASDTNDLGEAEAAAASMEEGKRRREVLRVIDEQATRLRTRWWHSRVPRRLWPLFRRYARSRLGIELAECDDVALADGTWLVSGRNPGGGPFQSGFRWLRQVFNGEDSDAVRILRSLRADIERVGLRSEGDYNRAAARLLDVLHGSKEREAQSFFDTWRQANQHVIWPPSSPLSWRLEEWNRRPVRAEVAVGDGERESGQGEKRQNTGGAAGLQARIRAARARRQRMIRTSGGGSGGRRDAWRMVGGQDVVVVMLVHNRPAYLRRTLEALSQVDGIRDTLLIISHDGYDPEMHALVHNITFCPVKQIYFPFSPHLFQGTFPGTSPDDCQGKVQDVKGKNGEEAKAGGWLGGACTGQADQYGSFRDARFLSLKHHWWWAMNTVWDGLEETKSFGGHVVWVEEDHLLFPNALSNLQALLLAKNHRCPHCIAANLAPSNVKVVQDAVPGVLKAERMGNVGYAFNRSVWRMIHKQAKSFCLYDDYNWDLTLWTSVFPHLPSSWSLRWSRASAHHVGSCGLHAGAIASKQDGEGNVLVGGACSTGEDGIEIVPLLDEDSKMTVDGLAPIVYENGEKHRPMFSGWGGWGDGRDIMLCTHIAQMYHNKAVT